MAKVVWLLALVISINTISNSVGCNFDYECPSYGQVCFRQQCMLSTGDFGGEGNGDQPSNCQCGGDSTGGLTAGGNLAVNNCNCAGSGNFEQKFRLEKFNYHPLQRISLPFLSTSNNNNNNNQKQQNSLLKTILLSTLKNAFSSNGKSSSSSANGNQKSSSLMSKIYSKFQ